jgi:hypothetical protein
MESAQVLRELCWLRSIEAEKSKFWTRFAWLLQRSNPMRFAPEIQVAINNLNVSGSTQHAYFSSRVEKTLPAPSTEIDKPALPDLELTFESDPTPIPEDMQAQLARDRAFLHPENVPVREPERPLIADKEPEPINGYMSKLRKPGLGGNSQPGPLRNQGNLLLAQPPAAGRGRQGDLKPIDTWTN